MSVRVETTSGRRTFPLQYLYPLPVLRHIVLQLLFQLKDPCILCLQLFEKVLPLLLRLVECY